MAELVDPADLVDTTGVAKILGMTSHRAVSVLRSRYEAFPAPVVDMGRGRCMLWRRQDVEAWARETGRLS